MYASIFIRVMPSTDEVVNYVRCNVSFVPFAVVFLTTDMTTSVFLYTDTHEQLEVFLNTTAYCLAFSAILVKMGRVYHIFNNPTEKKKVSTT